MLGLLVVGVLAFVGTEDDVTIGGFQLPIGFRFELLDGLLALYNEGEGRGLYPTDGEGLLALPLPVAQGVESGSIHTK